MRQVMAAASKVEAERAANAAAERAAKEVGATRMEAEEAAEVVL